MQPKTETTPDLPAEEVVRRVQELIQDLLDDGAPAPGVVFALAEAATDMGLQLSEDPRQAYAVLLSAITKQTVRHAEDLRDDNLDEAMEQDATAKVTIH